MSNAVLFVSVHTSLSCQVEDSLLLYTMLYIHIFCCFQAVADCFVTVQTQNLSTVKSQILYETQKRKAGEKWLAVSIKGKREMVLKVVREMLQQLANCFCD